MLKRSAGTSVSARIITPAGSASSTNRWRIAVWTSCSVSTASLIAGSRDQRVGVARFGDQDIERRDIGVPFDQGRDRAEPAQSLPIKRPHLADHTRAMIVDPQGAAIGQLAHAVAGQMNFADRGWRQRGNIDRRVPAVIVRTDKNVVDVA